MTDAGAIDLTKVVFKISTQVECTGNDLIGRKIIYPRKIAPHTLNSVSYTIGSSGGGAFDGVGLMLLSALVILRPRVRHALHS
jgi:hypothetical protein